MTESLWTKSRKRHLPLIAEVDQEPEPTRLHVTKNSKTGVSVDFAVHLTCSPTQVCMGVGDRSAACYALKGFMTFPNAVRHQVRNQRLMEYLEAATPTEVQRVAGALWSSIPRGTDWIRWNGAGDLSPGAVRLINAFSARFPDVTLWITSRKPALAADIKDRKSISLLMSIDRSTPAKVAKLIWQLPERFRKGRARVSYTRVDEEDVPPPGVHVVFNNHQSGRYQDWPHPAVCPASLSTGVHAGACDPCRRCFK